jgi:hypothetical protein
MKSAQEIIFFWAVLNVYRPVAAAAAPHQVGGGAGVVQVLPPTAQLTIFYAGMVHAYDDVALDKVRLQRTSSRSAISRVFFP